MIEKVADLPNPYYITYRNKRPIENLNTTNLVNRNIQIQSCRTVNLISESQSELLFERSMQMPIYERKLRKVLYPNPVDNLSETVVDHVIDIPKRKNSTYITSNNSLKINSKSQFTMSNELNNLNDKDQEHEEGVVVFVRNNNCIHFKSTEPNPNDQYPMFYTSSSSFCSTGLVRHNRSFTVIIEKLPK